MAEEQRPDPRQFPLIASVSLGEFGDELRDALSDILYVDGLDNLSAITSSLARIADALDAILARTGTLYVTAKSREPGDPEPEPVPTFKPVR